jgi:hypothetical protein
MLRINGDLRDDSINMVSPNFGGHPVHPLGSIEVNQESALRARALPASPQVNSAPLEEVSLLIKYGIYRRDQICGILSKPIDHTVRDVFRVFADTWQL